MQANPLFIRLIYIICQYLANNYCSPEKYAIVMLAFLGNNYCYRHNQSLYMTHSPTSPATPQHVGHRQVQFFQHQETRQPIKRILTKQKASQSAQILSISADQIQ